MMNKILLTGLLAATFFSSTAFAKTGSRYFEYNAETITSDIRLDISFSEDMIIRATDYAPDSKYATGSIDKFSAWARDGFYGEKELDSLNKRLNSQLTKQLQKRGVTVDDEAATVLKIVVVDAKPSRPTFRQLSKDVGLDFRSRALGGAKIEGELVNEKGESLGTVEYRYFENDLFQPGTATGIWSDAHRAIYRFASKLSKAMTKGNS